MVILNRHIYLFSLLSLLGLSACKKSTGDNPTPPGSYQLNYGDSILYQKSGSTDYIVSPSQVIAGIYSAFPDGMEIDEKTGAINVSKSETGLRYRINFTPQGGGPEYSTTILLSGINYLDAFYFLSRNDTVARPVYNANLGNTVPGTTSGTAFDIGLGCNNDGIAVSTVDGKINLSQTIRNGFFGRYPDNGTRKEFELKYKINDKSGQALNGLKIKLYYFETMNDVTPDLLQLLQERQGTLLGINTAAFPGEILSGAAGIDGVAKVAKPRPPCIFIIGR
jgi:hypothetical protein